MSSTALQIQLPKFEGPLALLLYLIRKEEMDIFDIQINAITSQYLEQLKLMQELDLEMAGEFVAMAATLIQIKSRMLLPQYNQQGEVVETEDPRKDLVQKLLEYQKYQEASHKLYERPLLNRDVWARGYREKLELKGEEILLEENALFGLISAYRFAIRSVRKRVHQVAVRTQSIASRIIEMKDRLLVGARISMSELIFDMQNKRRQVLITFLSILELGKLGFVRLYQSENFSEIYIETQKPIEGDAISRVEEYDSMRADDVADAMIQKAMKISESDLADEVSKGEDSEKVSLAGLLQDPVHQLDFIDNAEGESEFLLADESVEMEIGSEEMASDEEILAAEMHLEADDGSRESEV